MSINSPIKDGLYIRAVRPERRWIRYFIKNYPLVVGGLISSVVALSLITVDLRFTFVILLLYWTYVILRLSFRGNKRLTKTYSKKWVQFLRVIGLIICVTILLQYIYSKTEYLDIIQDDSLWLLYFPAISVTSQRGSRIVFFTVLSIVLGCLYYVHPVGDYTIIPAFVSWDITYEFAIKSVWLIFLSFTSYILIRYMSDAVADLNLIIKVQNKMRELEGALLRSAVDINETNYLEKAVEVIKEDLNYDHVNIFRLDKYNQSVVCVAGACEKGKELVNSNYKLEVVENSIIGHVVQSKGPYVSNQVSRDPYYKPHDDFPDTEAELAIPIVVRNRLYGVLDIQVHHSQYFLDQEIKAIEILANHIGWVIDNSEQFAHISWINRIVKTIVSPIFTKTHLDETLQEIADSAAEELDADLVFLYAYDPSLREKIIGPIYSGDLIHPELMDATVTDPDNVVFRLINEKQQIFVFEDLGDIDINTHLIFKPSPTHLKNGKPTFIEREKIKSNVIIQLKNNDQCVGVLFLNFRKPRKFSPWEQKRFSVFADLAALSIQKMQVQQHIIQKEKADLAYFNHNYLLGGTFGIFRLLKTINLNSNFYPKEKLQETIAQVIDTTGQLHNSIRWIDRMLKEEGFEDLMLELDRLREFFKQVFKVNTEIKWVGNAHQIPQNLSMELSLVFREALNNSVRHGKAKNIIVNNYVKSGKLNSTIVDDGIGFDPKTIKRMNGLLSMKYRIEEIGGSFKLTSNPGKGTKIVIRIPFQNSTEA